MRLSLVTMVCGWLACSTLCAGVSSIEVKAGLMPFTVYTSGAIRLYYNNDSTVKGISYYDNTGYKYATQDLSYDYFGTVARRELHESLGWFSSRTSVFSYQYSMTSRVLEENQSYGWNSRQLKYHYNLFGDLDRLEAYDTTSSLFPSKKESVEKTYTIDGKLSSCIFYNNKGKRVLTQKWIYDIYGRKAEFQTLDGNGELIWGTQYAYDVTLGCDVETQFGPSREVLSYIYTYRNDQGRIVERDLRDTTASVVTITLIDYNVLGQIVRVADYDSMSSMLGYVTTFYDTQARAYQHDFNYGDHDLLRDRVTSYLQLAGNDL
jgi:hypothetical protein